MYEPVLGGVPQDLSEHHRRGAGLDYNDLLDKFRTARWATPRRWSARLQILGGAEFAAKGYLQRAEARGCRLPDRGLLARRHEVGHLGGQDLWHPDQQRDDGAHLERRASSSDAGLDPDKPPATWDDVVAYSKQIKREDRQGRLRPGCPRERRQHAVSASCRSSGPMAAACSTRPSRHPTYKKIDHQQRGQQGGAAGVLRHVCPRQVGAGLGADQHADREPGSRSSPASSA